jgi:hypothetical protein
VGSNTSRPAVQLSFDPDRTADRDGQQESCPIQMMKLLRDKTQIHNAKIGIKAARIELNPASPDRGIDSPVAISTRKCGDLQSASNSTPIVDRAKQNGHRSTSTGGRLCG